MKINQERVLSRLEEIYQCGALEDGTFTRMAYSAEDLKGRETFAGYFRGLGIKPRMDEAGNLFFRLEGRNPALPAILTGSHLDTVPDGGKFDGAVGCVGALEVCQTLIENHIMLEHPLEAVVFTDEEGFRFGSGLLGSSAICGKELSIRDDDLDMYGSTRADVFRTYGIKASEAAKAKRPADSVHCFLELHIEQGGTLYKKKIPIGVVSSIAGVARYELVVTGEANHAGSTVMEDRKDALAAASDFISKVPETVAKYGNPYTVATVGTIKITPNSVNVIPGTCTFNLEIRDQSSEVMEKIESELRSLMNGVQNKWKIQYTFDKFSDHAPAPMAQTVKGAIEEAVKEMGVSYTVLPSGAFHDSLIMTSVFPTGMIFVPSEKGISHSRYEFTESGDIAQGVELLFNTVRRVDNMKISC